MIGTAPCGRDPLDVPGGVALIARDGRRLGDVQHVELVVGYPVTLGDRQLRGPDVHPAVELHGVGIHDLDGGLRRSIFRPPPAPAPTFRCRRADDREWPHG